MRLTWRLNSTPTPRPTMPNDAGRLVAIPNHRLLAARKPIPYSGSDVERSGVDGGVVRCPEMDVAEKSGTPQGEPRYHGFGVRVEQGPERELGGPGEGGATGADLGAGACAAEQRAQSGEP
jgi:hypothetical protein